MAEQWGIWCRMAGGSEFWLPATHGAPVQTAVVLRTKGEAELLAAAERRGEFCRPGDQLEVRPFGWETT